MARLPRTIAFVCPVNSCLEPSDPDDVTCDGGGCAIEVCVDAVPGCTDSKLECLPARMAFGKNGFGTAAVDTGSCPVVGSVDESTLSTPG